MRMNSGVAVLAALVLAVGAACSRTPSLPGKDPSAPHTLQDVLPPPAAEAPEAAPAQQPGETWTYTALDFRDDQKGWVAALGGNYGATGLEKAEAAIWETADAGKSWVRMGAPAASVNRFTFPDEKRGFALGTSFGCQSRKTECTLSIYATEDGGANWTSRFSAAMPGGPGSGLPILEFLSGNDGYALYVGTAERFLVVTADGGKTWNSAATLPEGFQPDGASFIDKDRGWVIGQACTSKGQITEDCKYAVFQTTDGGSHWSRQFSLPGGRRHQPGTIRFVDENRGWLFPTADTAYCSLGGCAGPLYRTEDGGKTWIDLKWKETRHPEQGLIGFPRTVFFVGPKVGWMLVGSGAGSGVGGIGITTDGGATWDRYVPAGVRSFLLLAPTSDQVAWAVGGGAPEGDHLMKTTDGAKSWTTVADPFAAAGAGG